MNGQMTIGVDAAAAAGPVGRQATAATDLTLSAEILSYSRSRGLFAGFAIDGASIQIDNLAGAAFYHTNGAAAGGANAWAGRPTVPPSAIALINRLARFSGAPEVAAPAASPLSAADAGADVTRQQLAAAWQRLATMLDPAWQNFLQPPASVFAAGALPPEQDLAAALRNYNTVAADPKFAALTQKPEFVTTHQLLRELLSQRARADEANLPLPPPPSR
jgi:hypothetical protein